MKYSENEVSKLNGINKRLQPGTSKIILAQNYCSDINFLFSLIDRTHSEIGELNYHIEKISNLDVKEVLSFKKDLDELLSKYHINGNGPIG
jgi:hypothetical protein